MESPGRFLILGGILLIVMGPAFLLASRPALPCARFMWDIRIEVGDGSLQVPFATRIVLSLVFTVILYPMVRGWRR